MLDSLTGEHTLFDGGEFRIAGKGKQLILFMIYMSMLVFRTGKDKTVGDLLISVANESTRELCRILLHIGRLDYRGIPSFDARRLSNSMEVANGIYSQLIQKPYFRDVIKSIYSKESKTRENDFAKLVRDIAFLIGAEERHIHTLTDHHLLSMLLRFGYQEFDESTEGARPDIRKSEIHEDTEWHIRKFPAPFINIFSNRNTLSIYNNTIRAAILFLIFKEVYDYTNLTAICDELGFDRRDTDDVLDLLRNKHYIIGMDYEYTSISKEIIRLTRKGRALLKTMMAPRYICCMMRSTHLPNIPKIQATSDTDVLAIPAFIRAIIDAESKWITTLAPASISAFDNHLAENGTDRASQRTMFSKRYFSSICKGIAGMKRPTGGDIDEGICNSVRLEIAAIANTLGYEDIFATT